MISPESRLTLKHNSHFDPSFVSVSFIAPSTSIKPFPMVKLIGTPLRKDKAMLCHLEIQNLNKPADWIWVGGYYENEDVAIERARKLLEVIPLVKVRVFAYKEDKVLWSNVDEPKPM